MKLRIVFIALLVSSFSWGQSIFNNPITGTNPNTSNPYTIGQTVAANMTASGIGRGSGILGTNTNDRYNSDGWSTGAIDLTDYFEFTMTPSPGYEINFVSFVYTGQVSSGTPNFAFRSSVDGYTSNIGTPSASGTTISLSASAYQNVNSAITFRFYAFGLTAAATTYSINDFTFNGTVILSVPCTTPTTQASALSSSNVTTTSANLSWTDGATTSGSLVSLRLAGAPTAPTSGTNYVPTLNFSTAAGANLISAGNVVVAKSNAGTVTGITGLTAGTQYTATPYAYNGSGTNVCFNTTNPESFNFWTLATEPASYGTGFTTCGASTATSIIVNFAAASTIPANGYALLYREGAAPTGLPTDGILYPGGTIIGDTTFVGIISPGITSRTVNFLNGGSTYYFILIPYNAAAGPTSINYRTVATIPSLTCSTSPAPEINVRGVIGSNPTIPDGDITPQGTDNTLFATVVVASNQSKVFRIQNTGNATLNVTSITMVGGNNTEFVVSGITLPTTIAGGGFLDFTVTFTPTAAGVRNTTLTIANNDANEATYDFLIQGTGSTTPIVEINVTGNGQSIPDNSIYPSGLNHTAFPLTLQGGSSTRTFTIENLGSTVLSLTGLSPYIQITGAHASLFTVTVIPSNSIAGAGSTTFVITFSPTSGGAKNATVTIGSNDTDETIYNFNISGTCQGANNIYAFGNGYDVPKASVTTSTLNLTNFGLIPITTGVKQNTFLITNLSTGSRYFSNVTVSGGDSAMFTVISQPSINAVGIGNSTSFTINFTPTSAGVKTTTVSFNAYTNSGRTTPDPLDPVYTFAISGEGIVYIPCSNNAVQTILQQDFETVPATPTWNYSSTSDGNITFTGGPFNNGSVPVAAFIGARSFQFRGIGTGTTRSAVLTMNSVDVSQYNNINLSMKVGAYRVSGATQGVDINDLIQIETSIDGGVNWSVESVLRGYSNSRWNLAATGIFNAYYTGNNTGVTLDSRNGNLEFANGNATYNVKNLPQTTDLRIRITLIIDRDDELWAIDEIKLEGQTAQSTIWNGTAWSAGFPTPTTKAIFDTGTTYTTTAAIDNGSVESCELQIRSGANVIVDSNYYFEIQSNIVNAGTLTIANNASLIQINDAATNSGSIVYQRTAAGIRGYDYVYWSSPVTGQSVDNIYSSPTSGFKYKWNPLASNINSPVSSGRWESTSGTMDVGTGYIVRGSSNYSMAASSIPGVFTGRVNNGVIPVTISRGNNTTASTVGSGNGVTISNFDDNWNLVGNPYPSAIRALDFLNANTNIQGFIYLWTHNTAPVSSTNPFYSSFLYNYTTNDYITYNGTATTSGPIGPPTFNGNIAGGQGFFVLMNDGATTSGTINFRNVMRNKTYANNQFYRVSQNLEEQDKHRIWLDLLDSDNVPVRTVIGYVPEASNGLDRLYDAFKNTANERNIYSIIENETQIIQGRSLPFNTTDTVQIGVRILQDGAYKIAIGAVDGLFSEPTQNIYIEDKQLAIIHDLRQNPYSFNATAGIINDRFVLRYNNNALSNPEFGSVNEVILTLNHGLMTIKSFVDSIQDVMVYDILGRQLFEAKAIGNKDFSTSKISISQQALIVKIKLENGTIVTRKIVL
ncbi:choice-of-anchor D domain-containing protein [Flavobacterium sp.]|jgi:hypothetical protein|uniref:choice-of-anchor D domain-containing protein n=1 Tax=Flavobacterium sp. TaxID=239 RepID=UPI0037BF1D4C